jgi:hypothetical protein
MTDTIAKVQLMIQDGTFDAHGLPRVSQARESKQLRLPGDHNDRFVDGPACRRIAVLDFDPATGLPLGPPAVFIPAADKRSMSGRFEFQGDPTSPAALAINAFGTVFLTIRMFEDRDGLGRQVSWAFGGEQLLVLPRAGEWANACYDRGTRSLQFFWFTGDSGDTVYTALSRDIVAHECGHALLDAVAPSLYDSGTPQSIAIHEGIADVVAVLMALDSRPLRQAVLERSANNLAGPNAFNSIADEFGMSRAGPDGVARRALRELANSSTMDDVARKSPHILSTVLSAIFYDTLCQIFQEHFAIESAQPGSDGQPQSATQAANAALGIAYTIFRRLLIRGIDYLPPGELTFADVGRATLAAARAVFPGSIAPERVRRRQQGFAQRFVDRKIVSDVEVLDSPQPAELSLPPDRLDEVRDSDYAAYNYVNACRKVLGIPADTPFTVFPRIDATKRIGSQDQMQRELIIKVGWNHLEDTAVARARRRVVPTGVTISLFWDTGRCLALVRSDVTAAAQRLARDDLMTKLLAANLLDEDSDDPQHVRLRRSSGVVSLAQTHRLLHLEDGEE